MTVYGTPRHAADEPGHPGWCNRLHPDDVPAHSGTLDTIESIDGRAVVAVSVTQVGNDAPIATVETIGLADSAGSVPASLDLDGARRLRSAASVATAALDEREPSELAQTLLADALRRIIDSGAVEQVSSSQLPAARAAIEALLDAVNVRR